MALRLQAWWHASELDRELAEGVRPSASPLLAARAHHIAGAATRRRMAQEIADVIASTRCWRRRSTAAAPVRIDVVRGAEDDLVRLAAALRDPSPASPRGAALAAFLLFDRASPLYDPEARTTVQDVAGRATEALRHDARLDAAAGED